MRSFPNTRGFRDDGCRMNRLGIARRLIEKLDGVRESQVGVCRAQRRQGGEGRIASQRDALFDKNRGGASGLQQRPVGEKCDLTCLGLLDSSNRANFNVGRALQAASQLLRNFRKFHGATPQGFLGLRASLA